MASSLHFMSLAQILTACIQCIKNILILVRLYLGEFFSEGPPLIQKMSSNRDLGTTSFESQKLLLGSMLTFSRLDVHILQILKYVDMPDRSTNSNIPFHNVDPILVH